ncbi:hypothetical protein [Sphingomonas sp. BK345]|uniref:hypothetical protein n=1 Tax=Sphingomonas sp. BK345 TaxID=2586980 RepID=UPI001614684B|nr:hypothetical protein [Sphingomonas sp. BK345]MBB3473487.1 hypothetical protein [Sphingomonas sp. BK345]
MVSGEREEEIGLSFTVSIPQIGDDDTVEEIDAFLAGLEGRVLVLGIIDDKAMALRVGGYRAEGQKPLVRERNPDNPGEDFARTHYNSMTFEFEREDEAREFHERFS